MAFTKRPSKRARRLTANAKRSVRSSIINRTVGATRIPRPLGPFPQKSVRTLRYVEEIVFSVVSGYGTFYMSANGLYDPNLALGGHQPLYFDQLMAIYGNYRVTKSQIKLYNVTDFASPSTIRLAICEDNDQTTSATILSDIAERPGAVTKTFPNTSAAAGVPLVYKYVADETTSHAVDNFGTSGNNPTQQHNFCCAIKIEANPTGNHKCLVEMEYTAVFDNQNSMTRS